MPNDQIVFSPTIIAGESALDQLININYANRDVVRDFFSYSNVVTALAAAGTVTQNINIAGDSDFICTHINCHANIANAAQNYGNETLPLVTMNIIDASTGRQLFDVDQPISNICGNGRWERPLATPRWFGALTTIQIRTTNFDAASAYNLRMSFVGVKIFAMQGRG